MFSKFQKKGGVSYNPSQTFLGRGCILQWMIPLSKQLSWTSITYYNTNGLSEQNVTCFMDFCGIRKTHLVRCVWHHLPLDVRGVFSPTLFNQSLSNDNLACLIDKDKEASKMYLTANVDFGGKE